MYERLKYLYNNNMIQESHLDVAVSKGWITEAEKISIMEG